ncbi:MAG: VWA domain-containing protein, partial [Vicinamibacteria bacterium]|nr:VWA domain-containing protein [Vicinamibacteria bacterium]
SATAVDGKGRPVRDLKRDELRIYDEGRLQPLVHFALGRQNRARLLLLIDLSGSMISVQNLEKMRLAVRTILQTLHPEDEVGLAGFDQEFKMLVPATRDRRAIENGLSEVTPFGATALHDALAQAAQAVAAGSEGRRAIVVITDGVDNSSEKTPDEVTTLSKALDVPIYTLTVLSPIDDPRSKIFVGRHQPSVAAAGSEVLSRYAAHSGGAAFRVSDLAGVRSAAQQVIAELTYQYRLGYAPPRGVAHFRRIAVRSTRKGVVVRTRSGYLPVS